MRLLFLENIAILQVLFLLGITPPKVQEIMLQVPIIPLPTNGYTKQYKRVNLVVFMKIILFKKISKVGIKTLAKLLK